MAENEGDNKTKDDSEEAVIELPDLLDLHSEVENESSNSEVEGADEDETKGEGELEQNKPAQTRKKAPPPEGIINNLPRETEGNGGDNRDQTLYNPQEVSKRLRKRFGIFLVLGAFVILGPLPPFGGAPAVAVMFGYLLYTKSLARRPTEREVFADSIYYMGFLFTFIALFKSIGPLAAYKDLGSQEVIGYLGIALSTTVVGMAVRLMMTHFDQILTAPEEDLRDNVAAMGAQLHDEIKKSITAFSDFRRDAIREMSGLDEKIAEEIVDRLRRVFDDISEQMTKSVGRIDKASVQFQERIDAIDLSPGILRDRVGAAFSEVDKEAPKFAEVIARTTEEADKLRKEVGKVGENMQTAANALSQLTSETESLSGLATAAVEGQKALQQLNLTIDGFKKAIEGIEARSQASYDDQFRKISNMASSIEGTQRTFENATREAKGMSASFEKVINDVLSFLRKELRR